MISKHLQNQKIAGQRKISSFGLTAMLGVAMIGGVAFESATSKIIPKIHTAVETFAENRRAGIKRLGHPARNYMEQALVGDAVGIDGTETPEQALKELKEYNSQPIKPLSDAEILHDNAIYRWVYRVR